MISKPFMYIFYFFVGSVLGASTIGAVVSEQCDAEGRALKNNTNLTAAIPSGGCKVNLDKSNSCSFNFSFYSRDFESVCEQLGGKFYTEDISLDCTVNVYSDYATSDSKSYDVTYNYYSYPSCLGGSCTEEEAMELYETVLFPAIEETFNCEVSAGFQSALHVVVATLSAVTAIVSFM